MHSISSDVLEVEQRFFAKIFTTCNVDYWGEAWRRVFELLVEYLHNFKREQIDIVSSPSEVVAASSLVPLPPPMSSLLGFEPIHDWNVCWKRCRWDKLIQLLLYRFMVRYATHAPNTVRRGRPFISGAPSMITIFGCSIDFRLGISVMSVSLSIVLVFQNEQDECIQHTA